MNNEEARWYLLNYVSGVVMRQKVMTDTVRKYAAMSGEPIELFAPTIVSASCDDGKVVLKEKPLTFHYVFARGTLQSIKGLCQNNNGFSFVLNHCGAERYATVDDRTMESFKTIARAYANQLPFYSLEGIDLEAGDTVEIVEGDFPGLVGTYMPRPKSTSGNIVIAVTQNLGTVVYDIKARYVRVLEFSPTSRRPYDQIDAYLPRLFAALRRHQSGQRLSEPDVRNLALFSRRLGHTRIHNPKLDAKLQALLRVTYHLLGDTASCATSAERLDRLRPSVTSAQSQALLSLLDYAVDHDPQHLHHCQEQLSSVAAPSRVTALLTTALSNFV